MGGLALGGRGIERIDGVRTLALHDSADQPATGALRHVQTVEKRAEHGDIAHDDARFGQAEQRRRLDGQRHDLGIGSGEIVATEGFEASLQELAGLAGAHAKDRAGIGIGRRLGRARGDVIERDGDGVFGAQAPVATIGILRHEDAAADILAGEIEEEFGRLQDRRLGMGVTLAGEERDHGLDAGAACGHGSSCPVASAVLAVASPVFEGFE